jgi:hypothetical protein
MKTRRRKGATLGLVAVCVLVIIVVGIGCFFLAKIFGGNREVANATDAGALNIAKNAMKKNDPLSRVSVSLPGPGNRYADFVPLADPPNSNEINLMTYNRCVAQSLLVAMNAQAENTPLARADAGKVIANLNLLGIDLKNKLANTQVVTFFGQVNNDTRMWGNTGLNAVNNTYTQAFMKHGESTNVYFTGTEIAGLSLPGNWQSVGTNKVPLSPSTGGYIRGYENLVIPGVGSIMGVPVFPQQNPHLVAIKDYKDPVGAAAPSANVPPNAFSIAAASKESKSNTFGGAVAAAIIGASMFQAGGATANYDFPAALPGGYLELQNLSSATLPPNGTAFDNSDNIFNNELYLSPGMEAAAAPGGVAFTKDPGMGAAWAAYNNSSSSNPTGGGQAGISFTSDTVHGHPLRNLNLWPDTSSANGGPYLLSQTFTTPAATPDVKGQNPPDMNMLLGIGTAGTNCKDQLDQGNLGGNCLTYLVSFEKTFHPAPAGGPVTPGLYSNVDLVKADVIAAFQNGQQSVTVNANNLGASGLGVFQNGMGANPTPFLTAPIQATGTINALLDQVVSNGANCPAKGPILAALAQRCYEIKPTATAGEVNALWNQTLPIGTTLYICMNSGGKLDFLAKPGAPQALTSVVSGQGIPVAYPPYSAPPNLPSADGSPGSVANTNCSNNYSIDGNMVNVPKGGSPADLNLHEIPYRSQSGGFSAQDHASLTLSSGLSNLLGTLQFSNTVSGVENFSRPN